MNSQNFFILIFKTILKPKKYITYLFLSITTIFILSFYLHQLDLVLNGNDLIKHYQLSKIEQKNFRNVETIIIGDSSGGNAIDALYFNKLSKSNTRNLCLTGSWGLVGSLGILKKSYQVNSELKNIIIIHTLDIWNRPYAKESILELSTVGDTIKKIGLKPLLGYLFNPKEILWNLDYLKSRLFKIPLSSSIDKGYDYIHQKTKKFSNHKKNISDTTLNTLTISKSKLLELQQLQSFCNNNNLNCILMNGPIHSKVANNSKKYIQNLQTILHNKNKIIYIDKIFEYPNSYIGDSYDHIDTTYKKQVTYDYYSQLKTHLQSRF